LESFEVTKIDSDPSEDRKNAGFLPLSVLLATGLGAGLLRPAPGTWGSLIALPLAWVVGQITSLPVQAVVIVAFCLASIPIATAAGRLLGRGKDPGCIVIDEVAGILLTFFLNPMSSIDVVVVGFVLFRLFDISKLPPARRLEHLPEGLGVMADDWAAALYANIALQAVRHFAPMGSL